MHRRLAQVHAPEHATSALPDPGASCMRSAGAADEPLKTGDLLVGTQVREEWGVSSRPTVRYGSEKDTQRFARADMALHAPTHRACECGLTLQEVDIHPSMCACVHMCMSICMDGDARM